MSTGSNPNASASSPGTVQFGNTVNMTLFGNRVFAEEINLRRGHTRLGFPGGARGKEPTCQCRRQTQVRSLGQEDPLEKEMAIHSSILDWEIPQIEEPGKLQSMGFGKSWTRLKRLSMHTCILG